MATSWRDRLHRVRVGFGLALQAGVAAGISWYIAHQVLGHVQPFFAPIAAVVVLAVSVGQRMRRAFEVVAGNAVGILLGEALILLIGRGPWQVGLAVLLAIMIAMFVGGSAPLITQAAASASLVATLLPPQDDYYFSRFMALGLADTADALEQGNAELAAAALGRLRDAEAHLRAYSDAITAGREISSVAPLRWRKRGALAQYVDSYIFVARALRNTRVLVRRALAMVSDAEPVPPTLVTAVRTLAEAVRQLRRELGSGDEPVQTRAAALRAVQACAEAYRAGIGFSGSVVVAQIRSAASDLISASGLPPEEAHRLVRSALAPAPESERPHQTP